MLSQFLLWLKTFVAQDEEAQTLVEYALILVLIAIVVIVVLGLVGDQVNITFDTIRNALTTANQ